VNRAYYHPEKHRTMLQRFRKQIIKKKNKITLPAVVLRAARNFKASGSNRQQQQQQVEEPAVALT
jgi:hypothetical protein